MYTFRIKPFDGGYTCGWILALKRQLEFACVECVYENNADVVGAINVLNRAMKMLEGPDFTARIAGEVNGAVCC